LTERKKQHILFLKIKGGFYMVVVFVTASEILGGLLAIVGFVMFFLMAATSNYIEVGMSMGISLLGLMSFLFSLLIAISGMKNGDEKSLRTKSWICFFILIISAIVGYFLPAYSSTFKIAYSNLISIFVTPIPVYIAVLIFLLFSIGWIDDLGDAVSHLLMLALGLFIFVIAGVGITGLNYFFGNDSFLTWADTNYRYENRIMLGHRESFYHTEDFETILKKDLADAKEFYEEKDYGMEKLKKDLLSNTYKLEYELDSSEISSDNEDIYICSFVDKARYDTKTGEFPRYYASVNFSTFEVVEILENQAMSKSEEENDFIKKIEKEKEVSEGSALYYAAIHLRNKKLEITKSNINEQLKNLKDNSVKCSDIEELDDTFYLVTMRVSRSRFMKPLELHSEQYTINKETYETEYYIE